MRQPVALVLGPHLEAVSGVSTHVRLLLASPLAADFRLVHFQVGSEGRREGPLGRALRLALSPFRLAVAIVARNAAVVHINTSLNARAYWRDLAYLAVARLCGARVVYQVHGGALPRRFCRGSRVLDCCARRSGWRMPWSCSPASSCGPTASSCPDCRSSRCPTRSISRRMGA
jgi:hypothetical protein